MKRDDPFETPPSGDTASGTTSKSQQQPDAVEPHSDTTSALLAKRDDPFADDTENSITTDSSVSTIRPRSMSYRFVDGGHKAADLGSKRRRSIQARRQTTAKPSQCRRGQPFRYHQSAEEFVGVT